MLVEDQVSGEEHTSRCSVLSFAIVFLSPSLVVFFIMSPLSSHRRRLLSYSSLVEASSLSLALRRGRLWSSSLCSRHSSPCSSLVVACCCRRRLLSCSSCVTALLLSSSLVVLLVVFVTRRSLVVLLVARCLRH